MIGTVKETMMKITNIGGGGQKEAALRPTEKARF